LPQLAVVSDCVYHCDPDALDTLCPDCRERLSRGETVPRSRRRMRVVELPINASEDRVVGAIDIEAAIKTGERRCEPGVLADVEGIKETPQRVEIVERRELWEADPVGFGERFREEDAAIGRRIAEAIVRFPRVAVPGAILRAIAELNVRLQVDGHRADLVARKAAQALAAYEGTPQVGVDEVKQVADMVLAHRVKGAGQRDFADLGRTLTNLARVAPS